MTVGKVRVHCDRCHTRATIDGETVTAWASSHYEPVADSIQILHESTLLGWVKPDA